MTSPPEGQEDGPEEEDSSTLPQEHNGPTSPEGEAHQRPFEDESEAGPVTFYAYRAQNQDDYDPENINVGDLRGVLYYLHNEVVVSCPRKFHISRIRRLKVTLFANQIGPFVAFDKGRCSVPNCSRTWEHGYRVGCQPTPNWCHELPGKWYSLPGACPEKDVHQKDPQCVAAHPGGRCHDAMFGECTYKVEEAGDVDLSKLVGIDGDYDSFCRQGKREYVKTDDQGRGTDFWNGFDSPEMCVWRQNQVLQAFEEKYQDMPSILGDSPACAR